MLLESKFIYKIMRYIQDSASKCKAIILFMTCHIFFRRIKFSKRSEWLFNEIPEINSYSASRVFHLHNYKVVIVPSEAQSADADASGQSRGDNPNALSGSHDFVLFIVNL